MVGRDAELARLEQFMAAGNPGATIVLIGAPGVGKTTLWEAAVASARDRGACALTARPAGTTTQLPFGGLIDLLDRSSVGARALPIVQRRAVEAALLRADRPTAAPAAVVALGLLGLVRALAERDPVVIAIEICTAGCRGPSRRSRSWSAASRGAVAAFLLARRPRTVARALEAVLARGSIERLQVETTPPLAGGATAPVREPRSVDLATAPARGQ